MTDVTPEGRSWLVSCGLLNLTHRFSHEHPSALDPGEFYDVEIKLFADDPVLLNQLGPKVESAIKKAMA